MPGSINSLHTAYRLEQRRRTRRLLLEQLEARLPFATDTMGLDFGDAPTSNQSGLAGTYPTYARDHGASHQLVGPQLGQNRTSSSDGQPDAHAQGDIGDNGAREFHATERTQLSLGKFPTHIAVGDFDGDLIPDVATITETYSELNNEQGVELLFGNGDGSLQTPIHFSFGKCVDPTGIDTADFDRDGSLDLIVSCQHANHVKLLLNDGSGSFPRFQNLDLNGGDNPVGVIAADLNGDGKPDIATVNSRSATVSIIAGNGDGTFHVPFNLPLRGGEIPIAVAVGDVDSNGNLDLVTANLGTNDLSILRNKGDGIYQPAVTIDLTDVNSELRSVAIADVNGDSRADLIAADRLNDRVAVLLGNSDGTFQPARFWRVEDHRSPVYVRATDFNHDGFPELVTVASNGDLSILQNSGDALFERQIHLPSTSVGGPISLNVVAADMNGDGDLDLIQALTWIHDIRVVLGNGDGTFQAFNAFDTAEGFGPQAAAVADFDGDGALDVATSNRWSDDVAILKGRQDGTFDQPVYVPLQRGSEARSIAAADLNEDGFSDFVTANFLTNDVSIVFGSSTAHFSPAMHIALPPGRNPADVIASDLNGDGHVDLATANHGKGNVSILIGRGDGTFDEPVYSDRLDVHPQSLVSGDFNNDGRFDMAVADTSGGSVTLLRAQSDGTYDEIKINIGQGKKPSELAVGDLDGDEWLDLAIVEELTNRVTILLNNGSGGFKPPALLQVRSSGGPAAVDIGDLNADGHADVIIANSQMDSVSAYFGRGDGTFQPFIEFALGGGDGPRSVTLADMNDDGRTDIVTANSHSHDVTVLVQDSAPILEVVTTYNTNEGDNPQSIAKGDFNSDGHLDLVAANADSDDVSLFLGYGDGAFHQPRHIPLNGGKTPLAIEVADFNSDGLLDVITANRDSSNITFLLGQGNGGFEPAIQLGLAGGQYPTGLAVADFDGDGHLDVATANIGSDDISTLFGRGDGTFVSAGRFATAQAAGLGQLDAGDVNGDGRLDLLISWGNETDPALLINQGNRVFAASISAPFSGIGNFYDVALGDVNGNTALDLVVSDGQRHGVHIYFDFWGNRTAPAVFYELGGGFQPVRVITADLNHDGRSDVITGNNSRTKVSVLLSNSDGSLDTPIHSAFIPSDYHSLINLVIADFNHDQIQDLAFTTGFPRQLSVALGTTNGTFEAESPRSHTSAFDGKTVASGDLNHDGIIDLVFANEVRSDVSVLLGTGGGSFGPPNHFGLAGSHFPQQVALGDLDGDGHVDVVTANSNSQNISILRGNGDGTLRTPISVLLSEQIQLTRLAVDEFNGDLLPDILVVGSARVILLRNEGELKFDSSSWITNPNTYSGDAVVADFNADAILDVATVNDQSISVLLGRADGSFDPAVIYNVEGISFPNRLAVSDINGDGHPDLITDKFLVIDDILLLGNGDGTFRNPVDLGLAKYTYSILVVGDINHDGNADVITNKRTTGAEYTGEHTEIVASLGRGSGVLEMGQPQDVGFDVRGISLADLNGDSYLDVLAWGTSLDPSVILWGDAEGQLSAPTPFSGWSGERPMRIAIADLNLDTIPDVAAVHEVTHDVSLWYGLGDGRLQLTSHVPLPYGTSPKAIAAADISGDGVTDLITVNTGTNNLAVILGTANGSFVDPVFIDIGNGELLEDIQVGDVTADGILDMVVADQETHHLLILVGSGGGTFENARKLRLGNIGFNSRLTMGDTNRDGIQDILLANSAPLSGHDVVIVHGSLQKDFQQSMTLDVDAVDGVQSVAIGQVNGDQFVDLVTTNNRSGLSLLIGKEDTFEPAIPIAVEGANPQRNASIVDVNGDGHLDLVANNAFENEVLVFLGNGDATFRTAQRIALPGSQFANDLALADMNGDGDIDLVSTDLHGNGVVVMPGSGDATFRTWRSMLWTHGNSPIDAFIEDINDDGHVDVVTLNHDSDDLSVLLGTEDHDLLAPFFVPLETGRAPYGFAAGDFTGDGVTDVLVEWLNGLNLLEGNSDGSFDPPEHRFLRSTVQCSPFMLNNWSVGDLNEDGKLDAVATPSFGGTQSKVFIFWGGDDETYQACTPLGPTTARNASVQDFNLDGHLDIAANYTNEVIVYLGKGDGTFATETHLPLQFRNPLNMTVADIDGDSKLDIITANFSSDNVSVFVNKGNGAFQPPIDLPLGGARAPNRIIAGDLDGDSIVDLITTNITSRDFTLLRGKGEGKFRAARRFTLDGVLDPRRLFLHDMDGDRISNLVTLSGDEISVVKITGHQTTFESVRSPIGGGILATALVSADWNRDGKLDIATVNSGSDDISIFQGDENGKFELVAAVRLPLDANPQHAIGVDLNSDGQIDIVTANAGTKNVSVILGSDESFAAAGTNTSLISAPHFVAAGDFNSDGHADVVVSIHSYLVTLAGNGDGTFRSPQYLRTEENAGGVAVGDVNGDGVADLATASNILIGNGNGTFQSPQPIEFPGFKDSADVVIRDIDRDGHNEIVVLNNRPARILIAADWVAGQFTDFRAIELTGISDPTAMKVVDTNGDNFDDIVSTAGNALAILPGSVDGTFGPTISIEIPNRIRTQSNGNQTFILQVKPTTMLAVDIDQDQDLDLLTPTRNGDQVVIMEGSPSGVFAKPQRATTARIDHLAQFTSGDFFGDDSFALVTRSVDSSELSLIKSGGEGSLQQPIQIALPRAERAIDMVASDFDADGWDDLVVATANTDGLYLLRGKQDGFHGPTTIPFANDDIPFRLAIADMNGDQRADLFVLNENPGDAAIIFVDTEGRMSSRINVPMPLEVSFDSRVATGDLDGDGQLEIFVSTLGGSLAAISRVGDGTYQSEIITRSLSNQIRDLASGDLDGDGKAEVVYVATSSGPGVTVLWNNGDRTFKTDSLTLESGRNIEDVLLHDVDGDNDLDILFSEFDRNGVSLIENEEGSLQSSTTILTVGYPPRLDIADLNGDGSEDIVAIVPNGVMVAGLAASDDDGIVFVAGGNLIAGQMAGVHVELKFANTESNRLDAWIDFNRDGDWDDVGEQVFKSFSLSNQDGIRRLQFRVPESASLGETFARFRLSTTGGLGPGGPASDGEVEDYAVQVLPSQSFDFGDAPITNTTGSAASYPTSIADDGARHALGGPRLGARVDSDSNGEPSPFATTDDATWSDDEDGALFTSYFVSPYSLAASVVTVSPADGFVDAWIDLDGDGVWGSDECVARSVQVLAGAAQAIPFRLFGGILEGAAARVRVSSVGGLSASGLAVDGEVEDYVIRAGTDSQPVLPRGSALAETYGSTVALPGTQDRFTIVLTSPITSNVVLNVHVQDPSQIEVPQSFLTFTPDNWNIPQVVVVRGLASGTIPSADRVTVTVSVDAELSADQLQGISQTISVATKSTALLDFGDADDSAEVVRYPTLQRHQGARHQLASGLFLGNLVDAEADGLPTSRADGDDRHGILSLSNDDDGVFFVVPPLAASRPTTASIIAVASRDGMLDAWLDFNGDKDWNDVGEQILSSFALSAGSNFVPYTVPAGAMAGTTVARFRLSSQGGSQPTGLAADGEVEDYRVNLVNAYDHLMIDLRTQELYEAEIIELFLDGGEVVATSESVEVFRAPISGPGSVAIHGNDRRILSISNVYETLQRPIRVSLQGEHGAGVLLATDANQLLDLSDPVYWNINGVNAIDLRGGGDNRLVIDWLTLDTLAGDSNEMWVHADLGDTLALDEGWSLAPPRFDAGVFYQVLQLNSTFLLLDGPWDWHNPLNAVDVNANTTVEPMDVLLVINAINDGRLQRANAELIDPIQIVGHRYLDVTRDGFLTSRDALVIVNYLNRVGLGGEGEESRLVESQVFTDFSKSQSIPSSNSPASWPGGRGPCPVCPVPAPVAATFALSPAIDRFLDNEESEEFQVDLLWAADDSLFDLLVHDLVIREP